MKKIILTGGGTAGHVTPNIALLPALKAAGYEVVYIGSKEGMEKGLIEACGVKYYGISTGKLRRSKDLKTTVKNTSDLFRVVKGLGEASSIIRKEKPDIIFSKGGFVSVPVAIGGHLNKVPVVAHESDITPGLANKLAMPFADKICCTFPEAMKHIKGDKGVVTGTPIRSELFKGDKEAGLAMCGFDGSKPVILVMGGSQGSVKINGCVRGLLPTLTEKYDIVHLCGKGNLDKTIDNPSYKQFEYISKELKDLFAVASIIISRAGSNSICEFLALGKPMLLIPLSKAASRGDQILNAASFKEHGFAAVLQEEELTGETLAKEINSLYNNRVSYISAMTNSSQSRGVEKVLSVIAQCTKENKKK
jgi:UDP-N-acetylglucosamine--N-acetylmuramyl-(pentapeptide) pyrophosphoryl-undecaprenol N-acetylglucosamine transferase